MMIFKLLKKDQYKQVEAIPIVSDGETIGYYVPSEIKFIKISDFDKAGGEWFTRPEIITEEFLYEEFKSVLAKYPENFLPRFMRESRVEATERFLAKIRENGIKPEVNPVQTQFYAANSFDSKTRSFVKKVFVGDKNNGRGRVVISINDLKQKFTDDQINDLVNGKINFLLSL